MIGLGILLILCLWAVVALMIANLIGKKLLGQFINDTEIGKSKKKSILLILLLGVLVFFCANLGSTYCLPEMA